MPSSPVTPPKSMNALTQLTFLFGTVEGKALDVVTFVDGLSRLCRGALTECSAQGFEVFAAADARPPDVRA
jgi:hypothetical protein